MGFPVLLSGASAAVTYSSFSSVISAIQDQISVTTVVGVLGSVAGIAIGLVFMWWGVRKAIRALMSAFRSGKFGI